MAKKKKTEKKAGKLSMSDVRNLINKSAGFDVAFDLREENPTDVKDWIPTGSRWLDSITCKGRLGGIPIGKISEIAGLQATGKSYLAAKIAGNAQKMDINVVYFDSESAVDSRFLSAAGCDISNLIYTQATNVEFVLETIENLLTVDPDQRYLFIWDSLAFTPCKTDLEGDFDPQSSMAVKPRILSKGLSKLIQPLANNESTLLVLNQLKANINTRSPQMMLVEPYFTPGGKALNYSYSLRVWLTGRRSQSSFVLDEKGYKIGSSVKAKIEKSRFGTDGRVCAFQILWGGDDVRICDKESWFEALASSEYLNTGAWCTLEYSDGTKTPNFRKGEWLEKLEDEKFYNRVIELLDEELIFKFESKEGEASNYYNLDDDTEDGELLEEASFEE